MGERESEGEAMSREEFEKVVKAMQSEGVALSMPNLMVRTELPRAVIEEWLAELERGGTAPGTEGASRARRGDARDTTRTAVGEALDELEKLKSRADGLRKEIVDKATEKVVKETLGVDLGLGGAGRKRKKVSPRSQKDLRIAGLLGLLGGPFGFFYAAPMLTAGLVSALYLVALVGLNFVPLLGTAILMYAVPIVHLASAVVSAAYAWRYNRSGKRGALIPASDDAES